MNKLGQLPPDFKCSIFLGPDKTAVKLADVFVVSAGKTVTIGNTKYAGEAGAGTELWWYSNVSDTVSHIQKATSIFLDVTPLADESSYNVSDASVTALENREVKGAWTGPQSYGAGTSYSFWRDAGGGKKWGIELNVGATTDGKRLYLNGIQWYRYDPDATPFDSTIPGDALKGQWSKGERSWTSDNPYSGTGYLAQTSMQ